MLSVFTSPLDWQAALQLIAKTIAEHAGGRTAIEIADIGAGTGTNSKELQNLLAYEYGISSRWLLAEPNAISRSMQLNVFSTRSACYRLTEAIADLAPGNQLQFDFILFLHSSYYTDDMLDRIKRYRLQNLTPGGGIIILAMEATSPFFLDEPGLVPPHTASAILSSLNKNKIDYREQSIRMRMRVPETIAEEDQILLYRLMAKGHLSRYEFAKRMRNTFGKASDLQDKLIFISAQPK